jgi:hypothetical protein
MVAVRLASISVPENTLAVTTVTATDSNPGDTLTYSISGTDAALFDINSASGVLTFKDLSNFEDPGRRQPGQQLPGHRHGLGRKDR